MDALEAEHVVRSTELAGAVVRIRFGDSKHRVEGLGPVEGTRLVADEDAVPQNEKPVGNRIDLSEPVGNIENGDSVIAEASNDLEKPVCFRFGERRGWLIEDEEAGFVDERPGEQQQLLVGDRKLVDIAAKHFIGPVEVEDRSHVACFRHEPSQR